MDKKITISVEAPSGLKVLGNNAALRIALKNLVGNAVKYTPAGGHITLRASVDPKRPGYALISVSDDGIGIDRKDQGRVFAGDERARTEVAKGMAQGTGLGLRRVKQLIEANGAELTLVSYRGMGSTFLFELPVVP